MLFRRLDFRGQSRTIALIRDMVEIVAIVAAGCWAIYVFVYTDKIEPYQKPLAPVVKAEITVDGVKGDLLALRLSQSIQNPGPAPMYVLGSAADLSGESGIVSGAPRWSNEPNAQSIMQGVRATKFDHIYAYVNRSTIRLDPGLTWEHSWIVFVPRRRYDVLIFDPSFKYTRDGNDTGSIRVGRLANGLTSLQGPGEGIGSETQLSTWRWQ